MSKKFTRRYPKSRACRYCGRHCSNKGIKQHERACARRRRLLDDWTEAEIQEGVKGDTPDV